MSTPTLHAGLGAQQLQKMGWQKGQGLGKNKQGIKTHVRVSRKADTKGIGKTDDHGFQWWDHIYNKSTSFDFKVVTEADEKKAAESSSSDAEKNAAPAPAPAVASPPRPKQPTLTGGLALMFVKSTSATLEMEKEAAENKHSAADLQQPQNAYARRSRPFGADDNYSRPLTDAELVAICEGRTGHPTSRFDAAQGKIQRADAELASLLTLAPAAKREREEAEGAGDEGDEEEMKKRAKKAAKKAKKEAKDKDASCAKKEKRAKSEKAPKEKKEKKKSKKEAE
ncbi:hypothetical protein H9P43_008289 [Blastocladiella emersonii ATCC 22665]|nr:hypothetical protein H9P43_008289 [Blastocladiella emersonii ATCC 22665]